MFSVFSVFTQTHKNKSIVNLYQKEWLGYFSEDTKMWPSHNVLMLILCYVEYTTVVKKYQRMKLL